MLPKRAAVQNPNKTFSHYTAAHTHTESCGFSSVNVCSRLARCHLFNFCRIKNFFFLLLLLLSCTEANSAWSFHSLLPEGNSWCRRVHWHSLSTAIDCSTDCHHPHNTLCCCSSTAAIHSSPYLCAIEYFPFSLSTEEAPQPQLYFFFLLLLLQWNVIIRTTFPITPKLGWALTLYSRSVRSRDELSSQDHYISHKQDLRHVSLSQTHILHMPWCT